MLRLILSFFSFICFLFTNSQTLTSKELIKAWSDDSITQSISYHKTEQDLYKNFDNVKANALITEVQDYLLKYPNERLSARLILYNEAALFISFKNTDQYSFDNLQKAIKTAKNINDKQLELEVKSFLVEKMYDMSSKEREELILGFETIGAQYFPILYRKYFNLSHHYYTNSNYKKTIEFAEKSLRILESKKNIVDYKLYFRVLDILGAAYNEIGDPNKGMYYYKKLNQASNDFLVHNRKSIYFFPGDHNNFDWSIVAKGGIGQSLITLNRCEEAQPLLIESYTSSHLQKEYYNEGRVLELLAKCEYSKQNYKLAIFFYKKAIVAANLSGGDINTKLKALLGLASTYKKLGNNDLYDEYYSKYEKSNKSKKVIETDDVDVESQVKTKRLIRILTISAILSIVIILLMFYLNKRYKKKVKITIRNQEKEIKKNEFLFKKAKQEHEVFKSQIEIFKTKLEEKSKLIQAVENIQISDIDLKELKDSTILTNEDWDNFREKFSKFYPSFIIKIERKYPQFTSAEIRYLCLIKLGMSSNQIASSLGVSPSSLRVTWYRIKKKTELKDHIHAVEFVENYL